MVEGPVFMTRKNLNFNVQFGAFLCIWPRAIQPILS